MFGRQTSSTSSPRPLPPPPSNPSRGIPSPVLRPKTSFGGIAGALGQGGLIGSVVGNPNGSLLRNRKASAPSEYPARQISNNQQVPATSSLSLQAPMVEPRRDVRNIVESFEKSITMSRSSSMSSSQSTIRGTVDSGRLGVASDLGDYLTNLLEMQNTRFKKTWTSVNNLMFEVQQLKTKIMHKEKKLWQTSSDDISILSKAEQLVEMRERNRKLKVEISCLVAEVDEYGDLPLGGDVMVRPRKNRTNLVPTGPSNCPPPIPPRTISRDRSPQTSNQSKTILDVRVPPPAISQAKKPTTLVDIHNSPLRRATSRISNSSANRSPQSPLARNGNIPTPQSKEEDDEGNKWRCQMCHFDNHPSLPHCEVCEAAPNPIATPGSTTSLSDLGAVGGNRSSSWRRHRRRLSFIEPLPLLDYSMLSSPDSEGNFIEEIDNPRVPVMVMMPLSALMNLKLESENRQRRQQCLHDTQGRSEISDTNANPQTNDTADNALSQNCCQCCCHRNAIPSRIFHQHN